MRNPFKKAAMRRDFCAYVRMYEDGTMRDSPKSLNRKFWQGYDGAPNNLVTKGSRSYAAFRAGQEVKKSEGKE